MISRPSIAIVGAGALGGYYGARLAQHGHDVHFLLRSDYAHIKAHGLTVGSVAGDFTLPPDEIHVYDDPHRMPKIDLIIVTLKSTQSDHLPRLLPSLLHETTTILTLQNGLGNEQFLADHFGPSRIVGGLAFVCINRVGPGRLRHLENGYIRVGEFAGPGRSERSARIAEIFSQSKVVAAVVDDLLQARWRKQAWNVPFNGLGALLDASTDRLLDNPDGLRLVRAIMDETISVARADGVTIEPDFVQRQIDATLKMGAYLTSTQLDRRQRKPMEIEAIFGQPVRIAQRHGLHVPLLEMLYFSLRQLDVSHVQ